MRFKETLEKYGITQMELADRLGINRVSVSRLLSEKNDIRLSTIEKIAKAIGCNISELVFTDSERETPIERETYIICPHCGEKIKISVSK